MKLACLLTLVVAFDAYGQFTFIDLDNQEKKQLQEFVNEHKVIAIGEIHGTTEVPLFVLELARNVLKSSHSFTVALEISGNYQKDIDAFMLNGTTEDLKKLDYFRYPDGRSSAAFMQLISGLKDLGNMRIICFDVEWGTAKRETRDSLMGANLWKAYDGSKMLILTGNLHATIDANSPMRPGFKSALNHFKDSSGLTDIIALNTYFGGGTAWNCQQDGCKEHSTGRDEVLENNGLANFIRLEKNGAKDGYSGFVFFNHVSSSKPAFN